MNCIGNSLSFNYHLFSFQAICKNSYLFKFCIFLYSFLFLAIQLGIYLCTFCFLSSLSIVFPCFSMISSVWDTDPVCTSNNKSIRKFLCDSTARLDFSLLLLVLLSLLILFSYFFVCQFFSLLLFFNLRSNSEKFSAIANKSKVDIVITLCGALAIQNYYTTIGKNYILMVNQKLFRFYNIFVDLTCYLFTK